MQPLLRTLCNASRALIFRCREIHAHSAGLTLRVAATSGFSRCAEPFPTLRHRVGPGGSITQLRSTRRSRGAGRGGRTPTRLPSADFESAASASSAIPALEPGRPNGCCICSSALAISYTARKGVALLAPATRLLRCSRTCVCRNTEEETLWCLKPLLGLPVAVLPVLSASPWPGGAHGAAVQPREREGWHGTSAERRCP